MSETPDTTATSNTTDYLLMIGIKLSDDQIKSIQKHNLDFEKIKGLQKEGQWPDTSRSGWNENFRSAVFVGYRKNPSTQKEDAVYLKTDGWFTTPEDLTNCNPFLDEQNKPIFVDGEGYTFGDMTAVAAAQAAKGLAESTAAMSKNAAGWSGGKTRKRKHKRKSKASRRYRK